MKPTVLVADDSGSFAQEIGRLLAHRGVSLARAHSLDECVTKARSLHPAVVVVYAGMSRGFSLLRLLKRSEDLARIPLVVVGDEEQEELMARHRQLPTRADRYLLRPLDGELTRSVIFEFTGGETTGDEAPEVVEAVEVESFPPPLPVEPAEKGAETPSIPRGAPSIARVTETPQGTQAEQQTELSATPAGEMAEGTPSFTEELSSPELPDAHVKVQEELRRYRERVHELEREIGMLMKASTESTRLREENEKLRQEIARLKETRESDDLSDSRELFQRLEAGYKQTIEDLERGLREKEEQIARLTAGSGLEGEGKEIAALAQKQEQEQGRLSELARVVQQLAALLQGEARAEEELQLDTLMDKLKMLENVETASNNAFAFEEATATVETEAAELGFLQRGDEE